MRCYLIDWLVVSADALNAGRGVRGLTLAGFLRTYFGRGAVAMQTPENWRRRPIAARTVFVGFPSSLTPDELGKLVASSLVVPFDYLDQHELAWNADQADALRSRTEHFLKTWREPTWRHDRHMGLLPIRRYARLAAAAIFDRWTLGQRQRRTARHDIAFIGRPNQTQFYERGHVRGVDQRLAWIREIKRNHSEWTFWGGLSQVEPRDRQRLEATHGDIRDLIYPGGQASWIEYYRQLRQSRVLLAPGGNVPWTYRHYENLYAGGVVVSIDFRSRELLIPLPVDGMIHIADDASDAAIGAAIEAALRWYRDRPNLAVQNRAHLNRYLWHGTYSRRRPMLLERFLQPIRRRALAA